LHLPFYYTCAFNPLDILDNIMGKIRQKKKKIIPDEIEEICSNEAIDDNDEEELAEHNEIDFDKRSVVSNKTIKSLVAKKKDKMKLKKQFLLKRKKKFLRNSLTKFCF
jgi:hypothetical protein